MQRQPGLPTHEAGRPRLTAEAGADRELGDAGKTARERNSLLWS